MKFTLKEVLAVNGHKPENTPKEVCDNLNKLISKVNAIGTKFTKPMLCSSGYRDPAYNKKIGGATKSAHCLGKAMDIRDPKGELKKFLMTNPKLLEEQGLRMEHPDDTGGMNAGWCHLDIQPVKYNRIFHA